MKQFRLRITQNSETGVLYLPKGDDDNDDETKIPIMIMTVDLHSYVKSLSFRFSEVLSFLPFLLMNFHQKIFDFVTNVTA